MLTDMSGVYADIDGQGGAEAIRMAIADLGGNVNGKKIEFIVADHQNKADVAGSKARTPSTTPTTPWRWAAAPAARS
jgi:branched-chain amino acid transport system substrate-binding protein